MNLVLFLSAMGYGGLGRIMSDVSCRLPESVNQTMVGIHDITRNLTVSVNEIKGTSDNFARLAADLQQMVGWFRL